MGASTIASKIGRNDPCPCGSGRKYKHCCLGATGGREPTGAGRAQAPGPEERVSLGVPPELMAALHAEVGNRDFESVEQLQDAVAEFMARRNALPRDEFLGLSASEMKVLLEDPFGAPAVLELAEAPPGAEATPIMRLVGLLGRALAGAGLGATAKGNLPRAAVRELMADFLGGPRYDDETRYGAFRSELEARPLLATRSALEFAGLVRLERGRWRASAELAEACEADRLASLYRPVAQGFVSLFNWAYRDRLPDFEIMQQGFGFTLYLLARFGHEPQPVLRYVDAYARAFPMLLDEAEGNPVFTPMDLVTMAYQYRVLDRAGDFLGLVALRPGEPSPRQRERLGSDLVSATPLFEAFVRFPGLNARGSC